MASHTIRNLLALSAAVLLTGCSSFGTKPPAPPSNGHRTIAEGYSLLYAIVSQQNNFEKILWVKSESDPVDHLITEIADYAGKVSAELEDIESRYPAVTLRTQFLPEVEARMRESVTSDATKSLLTLGGREFERELLLKQRGMLNQERHLARVMIAIETAEDRRQFWRSAEIRFTELHGKVGALLENYFCN